MKKLALLIGLDSNLIAKSIYSRLINDGYDVIATYESTSSTELVNKQRLNKLYPAAKFERIEFGRKDSIVDFLERVRNNKFDVIINSSTTLASNADGSLRNEFQAFDFDEFSRVISYNLTTIAAICIGLKDSIRSGGVIINIVSSAADEGAFSTISYNASKAAVINLSKSLGNNLGIYNGIRVNCVSPGWIPPTKDAAANGVVAIANALTPCKHMGTPEDVTDAVFYCIKSQFINGVNIKVDGGITSSYLPYLLETAELNGVSMKDQFDAIQKSIVYTNHSIERVVD